MPQSVFVISSKSAYKKSKHKVTGYMSHMVGSVLEGISVDILPRVVPASYSFFIDRRKPSFAYV
jgi:hypothetical protein